jgi:hypothetical protein
MRLSGASFFISKKGEHMALAEITEVDIAWTQAEALAVVDVLGNPFEDDVRKKNLQVELDASLQIIQEHLRTAEDDLVVNVQDVGRMSARMSMLLGEYGAEESTRLVVPRKAVTAVTLNALWGEAYDCSPVADIRIVSEQDPPINIYGQEPVPSLGGWSRFSLGQILL